MVGEIVIVPKDMVQVSVMVNVGVVVPVSDGVEVDV
jgi:hypothetical protein